MSLSKQYQEMPEQGIFILPGGFMDSSGICYKDFKIRHLTGKEEEIIFDCNGQEDIHEVIVNILSNCVQWLGSIKEINPEIIRNILICDRDYILLKLRQLTFGDRVDATVQCPNDICKKQMDIDFDLKNIEVQRKDIGNGTFLYALSDQSSYKDQNNVIHSEVEFRLPTIRDQEFVAKNYKKNISKAITLLLARCIKRIGTIKSIDEHLIQSLSIKARQEIEKRMQDVSPKIDLVLNIQCPECQYKFTTPFDIQNFFLAK